MGGRGPRLADQDNTVGTVSGVAGRYATAIFELARDAGKLDAVSGDFTVLSAMLRASADLMRTVRSPVFTRIEQAAAMAAIGELARADDLTRRFIGLVASKRRLFALPQIIASFNILLANQRGEVSAQVTSAHPLDAASLEQLKAALKRAAGRDVQLQTVVDESLLGGLIVRMGSRMLDGSLATKLSNLQLAMKEVG